MNIIKWNINSSVVKGQGKGGLRVFWMYYRVFVCRWWSHRDVGSVVLFRVCTDRAAIFVRARFPSILWWVATGSCSRWVRAWWLLAELHPVSISFRPTEWCEPSWASSTTCNHQWPTMTHTTFKTILMYHPFKICRERKSLLRSILRTEYRTINLTSPNFRNTVHTF